MTRFAEPEEFLSLVTGRPGADPGVAYQRCHQTAPIFFSDVLDAWVVTRYDDVTRVLKDEEFFGGPLQYGSRPGAAIHGRVLLHMSGEEHRKKTGLIAKRLRSPVRLRTDLNQLVLTRADALVESLEANADFVDLKLAFADALPLGVMTHLINVHEAERFRAWYEAISGAGGGNPIGDPAVFNRGFAARDELYAFFTPIIAERRQSPGDDLLSDLCVMEFEGERMSDDEIKAFMSFMLVAGVETTARVLGSLLKLLLHHPQQWQLLKRERELVTSAAAEALRFSPPHHATKRETQVEVELHGVRLPAGSTVIAVMGAANRDEARFPAANTFDVTRFATNADQQFLSSASQVAFGGGRHFCTGSLLAKLEMTVGLRRLLERLEWMTSIGPLPDDVGWPLRGPAALPVSVQIVATPTADTVLH